MTAAEHRRILLLGAIIALAPMSIDLYLPALPTLQQALGGTAAQGQLTLSVYFLGLAMGQLIYGPVSDRIGRRKPLYFGLALYALAALGCTLATDINSLIALRFLQALGGCAGMVIVRAVVRDLYTPQDMARVLSMLLLVMGVAPILAPLIGSWVFVAFGWQAVFGVLVAYGLACLIMAAKYLPETLARPGEALEFMRVLKGYGRLLRHRRFMGYALSGGIAQASLFAYIAVSSFVFIDFYALSPTQYGLLFGVNAFGLILGSQINNWMLTRYRAERVLRSALIAYSSFGVVLALVVITGLGGLPGVLIPLWCCIASLGFTFPNSTAAAMAPFGDRAGMAAALLGTLQYGLAAIASGVVASLHDGTALAMALAIAACGLISVIVLRVLTGKLAPF
ncbi:MAG: multidrug effflux MFS transporter [Polycyclovorans sp.]|jgi:MFS transporter, DHA1 family, multidrug resistance protein|nr:Bcr/CflA family drug resistance efflux transporter [Polycyclovorans sp.]MDP1544145.1 multidrug effflux MFS transporter [Polycyclovorans sp.]|tara:strand:- start:13716 stop:14900 length:1185 start_codon:yes stop_codon:yes gene_type:complete